MKRTTAILAGTALVTAVLTVAGGGTAGASTPNCQHHLGDGAVRSATAVLTNTGQDTIGAIQLCKDSSSRYWAYMVMYSPLPRDRWANVTLGAYWDGSGQATYSCDAPGGNGHILPGQTMCWTPKIYGTSTRWTYDMTGVAYARTSSGGWDDYAWVWLGPRR